jgi:hypothetical protein
VCARNSCVLPLTLSQHFFNAQKRSAFFSLGKRYSILSLKFKYSQRRPQKFGTIFPVLGLILLPLTLSQHFFNAQKSSAFFSLGKKYSILSLKFKYSEKATNFFKLFYRQRQKTDPLTLVSCL